MLGLVKDNKIIPLTTDTGTGAPIGTLIQQYKKKPMSGYLYCDGSTFDENVYPALYMYLGTNVLPDYRECVMVGAEQNTTDTIATHDVYGEGEFKDDQLQQHEHQGAKTEQAGSGGPNISVRHTVTPTAEISGSDNILVGRHGDTTHGKQKAVYVYIKATSGLMENQQDNVLRDVKEYIRRSNELSPIETISLTTTNQTIQYDGILFIRLIGNNTNSLEIYINDVKLIVGRVAGNDEDTIVLPVCKGDTIRISNSVSIWESYARWYKNR